MNTFVPQLNPNMMPQAIQPPPIPPIPPVEMAPQAIAPIAPPAMPKPVFVPVPIPVPRVAKKKELSSEIVRKAQGIYPAEQAQKQQNINNAKTPPAPTGAWGKAE